ncbi:MAG: tetratricopeptide repeat protein [Cyanobacteria bacterium]|nr:tetratricopeptide repeat protein [Cyanobacteriota bacterium]
MNSSAPTAPLHPASDSEIVLRASELVSQGELEQAEQLLRQLVDSGCSLAKAWMNLGVIVGARGDKDERLTLFHRARELDPNDAHLLLNLATAYHENDDSDSAEALIRQVLLQEADLVAAHHGLAVVLAKAGRTSEARMALATALELDPDHWQSLDQLTDLKSAADLKLAEAGYRRLIAAESDNGSLHRKLAVNLGHQLRIPEAVESYRTALNLNAADAQSLIGLGLILLNLGQADESLVLFLQALALDPDNGDTLACNGLALHTLGDQGQAIEMLDRALVKMPERADILNVKGECHSDIGQLDQALASFKKAQELDSTNLAIKFNLSNTLRTRGDLEAARIALDELLAEKPLDLALFSSQMFLYSVASERWAAAALELGQRFWPEWTRVFAPESDPSNSDSLVFDPTTPGIGTLVDSADARRRGKVRIGILSGDLGGHVVGGFLAAFLEHYDHDKLHVELLSMRRRYESRSEELIALADGALSLEGLSDPQARDLLRSRDYDLILETSGYTRHGGIRLLAQRCAPVQCHYIGYHATTALPGMDYFIGDLITADPAFQDQFSEQLWQLPRPWLAYPKHQVFPAADQLAATDLPVLGAFSQVGKIRAETLSFWGPALKKVPDSLLVIKDRCIVDPNVCERIADVLAKEHDVDPQRLRFLPLLGEWNDHVDCYNILDVALDTTPWSSATTGFEALAMGAPLVAIKGGCTAARMSTSLVQGVGRPEWVARTPDEFAGIVAELCSDLPALRAGKQERQRQAQNSSLFDGLDLAQHLQGALIAMVIKAKQV